MPEYSKDNPFSQFIDEEKNTATAYSADNPFAQYVTDSAPDRSALGEIGTGLKRGVIGELPKQIGKAMQWASEPDGSQLSQTVYETGKGLAERAEERLARPENTLNPEQHNVVTNALASGAEMLAPSIAIPAAVGAGIALAPEVGLGATAGLGISALAGAVPMGMAQAQETKENVEKAGGTPEQANVAGWKSGAIETVGETVGTYLGGKLLGIGGKVLSNTAKGGVSKIISNATDTALWKPYAKQLAATALGETATEMGQSYGQATVEQNAGVDVDPTGQAISAIAPTLGMTALLAPFGLAGHYRNTRKAQSIDTILADPEAAPPEARLAVVNMLHDDAQKAKVPDADLWFNGAVEDINNGLPVRRDVTQGQQREQSFGGSISKALGTVSPQVAEPAPLDRALSDVDWEAQTNAALQRNQIANKSNPAAVAEGQLNAYNPELPIEQRRPEYFGQTGPATASQEEAEGSYQERNPEIFNADKTNFDYSHLPEETQAIMPSFERMVEEINAGQVSKSFQNEEGDTSPTVSSYPDWFKQRTVNKYNKETGQDISLSKENVNRILTRIKQGKVLIGKQPAIFDYLKSVAEGKRGTDPAVQQQEKLYELSNEGFEFKAPQNIPVGNLKQGDEVVILGKNGIPDKLTHKGRDKKTGDIILQDGVRMQVDEFDQIEVVAQRNAATPSAVEPSPVAPSQPGEARFENNTPNASNEIADTRSGAPSGLLSRPGTAPNNAAAVEATSGVETSPNAQRKEGSVKENGETLSQVNAPSGEPVGEEFQQGASNDTIQPPTPTLAPANNQPQGTGVSGAANRVIGQPGAVADQSRVTQGGNLPGEGVKNVPTPQSIAKAPASIPENAAGSVPSAMPPGVQLPDGDGAVKKKSTFDPLALLTGKQGFSDQDINEQKNKVKSLKEDKFYKQSKDKISAAEKQIEISKGVIADWSARTYKDNKRQYDKTDMYGQDGGVSTFGAANERRRKRNIELAQNTIKNNQDIILGERQNIARHERDIDTEQSSLDAMLKTNLGELRKEQESYIDFLTKQESSNETDNQLTGKTESVSKSKSSVTPMEKRVRDDDDKSGKTDGIKRSETSPQQSASLSELTPSQKRQISENGNTFNEKVKKDLKSFLGKGYDNLVKRGKLEVVRNANDLPQQMQKAFLKMVAWHGTPHDVDKFSSEKIGTGEGAQAYGFGLYFAGSREVAKWYRDKLSNRPLMRGGDNSRVETLEKFLNSLSSAEYQQVDSLLQIEEGYGLSRDELLEDFGGHNPADHDEWYNILAASKFRAKLRSFSKQQGKLYQVELAPKEDEYLLWDKPLSGQKNNVVNRFKLEANRRYSDSNPIYSKMVEFAEFLDKNKSNFNGSYFYRDLSKILGSDAEASSFLHGAGIRGIKYLDGTSRSAGDGNYNYVIFNDEDIQITAIFSKNGGIAGSYFPSQKKVFLFSDNLKPGDAVDVMRHEAGHALLNEDKIFRAKRTAILKDFAYLAKNNPAIKAAFAKVPKRTAKGATPKAPDTAAGFRGEEALMYWLQEPANRKHSLFKRIISAVKAALYRMGLMQDMKLSESDLVALFTQGVKAWAKREADQDLTKGRGVNDILKSEKQQDITDNKNFIYWFGKSRIKSGNKPTILYHGTNDPNFLQNKDYNWTFDPNRAARQDSSAFAGLGFFLGNESIAVAHSGGNDKAVHPFYVRVENPLVITSAELEKKVTDLASAKAFRKRAMELDGHDGIIISDRGQVIAFEPNQLKSASDNTGEFSRSDDDVRFSVTTEADFAKNRGITRSFKQRAITKAQYLMNEVAGGLDKYLGASSSRLYAINPKVAEKVRRLYFDQGTKMAADVKEVQAMLNKAKKMSRADFADWDYARKNSVVDKIDELVKKYGMEAEYAAYKATMERVWSEAKDVGLDIGYIEDYSPRILKDHKGFLNAIGKGNDFPDITRRLEKRAKEMGITVAAMTPEMRADIISAMVSGGFHGRGTPGATKERTVKKIRPELNQYYMSSDAALVAYLHSMRKAIEARKFFGKVPERISNEKAGMHRMMAVLRDEEAKAEPNQERIDEIKGKIADHRREIEKYKYQRDFTENIGAYIDELRAAEELQPEQERDLIDILSALFHEKGTHGILQAYKNFSYLDTMGSITSAVTQIGDLAWAVYENGWTPTLRGVYHSLKKDSRITKEDVGIERIAQEFADTDTLSNAVAKVFKIVGLEKMDAIGKEAFLNGALEKFEARAKADPGKLKEEIKHIFEGETDSVISDLQNKKTTDNVKLLVYSKLLDFQPAALSEMSEMYLKSGNGRIFYMLKSYTLKQFDVFRREVFTKLKNGDKQEKIQAMKNLVYLSGLIVLANAGADEIKDLILDRETDWEDRLVDNILRLFGVSKWATWQARTDGIGSAALKQILPPMKFIDSAYKDVINAGDDKGLFSLASVPLVGKLAYWHMGRGQISEMELYEKRLAKEKKSLAQIKDRVEVDNTLRGKYQPELTKLRRINNFQSVLNENKKRINLVKKREKLGADVGDRVEVLQNKRTEMIKSFLDRIED